MKALQECKVNVRACLRRCPVGISEEYAHIQHDTKHILRFGTARTKLQRPFCVSDSRLQHAISSYLHPYPL